MEMSKRNITKRKNYLWILAVSWIIFLMFCWENKSGMLLLPTTIYLLSQNLLSRSWFSGFPMRFPLVYTTRGHSGCKIQLENSLHLWCFHKHPKQQCSCAHQRLWRTEGQLLQLHEAGLGWTLGTGHNHHQFYTMALCHQSPENKTPNWIFTLW